MAAHPIEFRQQHAHPLRPLGNVAIDTEQLLGSHRKHELVVEWACVIHASDVGATLHKGELLTSLFHTGMQVTDDGLAAKNRFALEFKHEPEHAVG